MRVDEEDAIEPVGHVPLEEERDVADHHAIAAQMPAELKRARADFVIDNVGTVLELEREVDRVWREVGQLAEARAGVS